MKMLGNVDPNTGMPMPGGRAKNPNIGNPNRKKIRHKKKKKQPDKFRLFITKGEYE